MNAIKRFLKLRWEDAILSTLLILFILCLYVVILALTEKATPQSGVFAGLLYSRWWDLLTVPVLAVGSYLTWATANRVEPLLGRWVYHQDDRGRALGEILSTTFGLILGVWLSNVYTDGWSIYYKIPLASAIALHLGVLVALVCFFLFDGAISEVEGLQPTPMKASFALGYIASAFLCFRGVVALAELAVVWIPFGLVLYLVWRINKRRVQEATT